MAKPRDIHEAASRARAETTNTDAKRGKVVSISRDYDDPTKVRVEIELPPVPRKKGIGAMSSAPTDPPTVHGPRETVTVDEDFARELAIGDRISVTTTTAVGVATPEVPELEGRTIEPIKPVQVMPRFRGR